MLVKAAFRATEQQRGQIVRIGESDAGLRPEHMQRRRVCGSPH